MSNLKYDTENGLFICETETGSWARNRGEEWEDWEFEVNRCENIQWVINKISPITQGTVFSSYVTNHNGK